MAETDHSFFDNFSDHLQSTVGQQVEGLSQLKIENAKMNTRRFAKRQLTWFKKSPDIQWFDYKEDREKIIDYIEKSFEL